jgi:hypothetical protein
MRMVAALSHAVMPGFTPGIHVFLCARKAWMAGTSPTMTRESNIVFGEADR